MKSWLLLVLLVLFAGSAQAGKGCGVEPDFGGLCSMALGTEHCEQFASGVAFLPSFMRPPTAEEAKAAMDKKCDELKRAGIVYAIKKFFKNPAKAVKSVA